MFNCTSVVLAPSHCQHHWDVSITSNWTLPPWNYNSSLSPTPSPGNHRSTFSMSSRFIHVVVYVIVPSLCKAHYYAIMCLYILFIHSSTIDTWVVSTFLLLWTMLLWTSICPSPSFFFSIIIYSVNLIVVGNLIASFFTVWTKMFTGLFWALSVNLARSLKLDHLLWFLLLII